MRRRFTVTERSGRVLQYHDYWSNQGDEFFAWATRRSADPEWRSANGPLWSEGLPPAELRAS